jgi:C1A family cysteine protease
MARCHTLALLLISLACICGVIQGNTVEEEDTIIAMIEDDDTGGDDRRLGEAVTTLDGDGLGMDEKAEFDAFNKKHSKNYKDQKEYHKRFGVWKDNLDFVRKWNSDSSRHFSVGMNEFADLTDDEFAQSYLNKDLHNEFLQSETFTQDELLETSEGTDLGESAKTDEQEESSMDAGASAKERDAVGYYDIRWHKNTHKQPDSVDWTTTGAVSEVNNQAKCFACYAFAACGAIEGALVIQGKPLRKLSAQQIVDCSTPSSGFMNHGCKGGTMVKSYKYIIKNGLMPWTDYGYRTELNSRPECKLMYARCKYKKDKVVQTIDGYVNIRKGSEHDMRNAVGMRPVSAAIDAHHRPFKLYRSGVFSLDACTTHLTHGLLIVGYGEKEERKYWKVKNSWGSTWGNGGYGLVLRDANMCAIGNWANYPIIPNDHVSTVRSLAELGDDDDDDDPYREKDALTQALAQE